MASVMAGILLLGVAGVGINKLLCLNETSNEKNVIRNRDVPNFVTDLTDEIFNPMNTGSKFNELTPVSGMDEGPFGITRVARKSNTDSTYYSYGSILDEY